MRKFLLSIFFVAIAVLGMAQTQKVRTNPDEADFYIKGDLSIEEINGKVVYKLSKVESQGIYFENKTIREGFETDKEDVLFQFSRARVDLPHTLDDTLDFWRYDKAIDEWQPDGETRQGTAGVETKKSAVIMLVIDCSGSIGKDFNKVQNAARSFVDYVYDKTNGIGNIKMGIIGFSKMNETVENVFEITPLTSQSRSEMIRFINNLTTQNGTALYFAMDRAVQLMDSYKYLLSLDEPLAKVAMVTFTDGLDQTSKGEGILTADDYYDRIISMYGQQLKQKNINGIHLQSIIRGVRGDDITTDKQMEKFKNIGNSLGDFKMVKNYAELDEDFKNIAKGLIDEFSVLNLYVPNSFKGQVAWTYPGKKKKEVVKVKSDKKWFFGLNAGLGFAFHDYYKRYMNSTYNYIDFGVPVTVGFDFAAPITSKFNLGVYFSMGYEIIWSDMPITGGPLFIFNLNKGSLYTGIGFDAEPFNGNFGGDFRFGYEFNSGLYIFYEHVLAGGYDDIGSKSIFHIGYNFLNKKGRK